MGSVLPRGSPVCFLRAELYISSTTSLGAESDRRFMTVPPLIALPRVPDIRELISSSSAATAAIGLKNRLPSSARSPPHDMASLTGAGGGFHTQHLSHSPINLAAENVFRSSAPDSTFVHILLMWIHPSYSEIWG